MTLFRLFVITLVIISSSCTAPIFHSVVGKMVLDGTIRPPKNVSDVEVLLEEPAKSFKDIVIVEISDGGLGLGLDAIKKAFAVEAAKLGGDAVIVSRKKDVLLSRGNENNYEGRIIIYNRDL